MIESVKIKDKNNVQITKRITTVHALACRLLSFLCFIVIADKEK